MKKLPERFYDNPGGRLLMCSYCAHRGKRLTCKAYPQGIPRELLLRGEHDTPFPGDNGIRFKQREDRAKPN